MTEGTSRFALDEDRARQWIADAIARTEGERPDRPGDSALPCIESDYSAAMDDEYGSSTHELVSAALAAEIITDADPADWPELAFCYEPYDGTSSGYRWQIDLGDGAGVQVSGGFREMRDLGQCEGQPEGAELALAVLREATEAGNEIMAGLGRYIAALPLAVRAPEIAQLAAMLPDGEWGADELGTVANWLNGLGFTTVSED